MNFKKSILKTSARKWLLIDGFGAIITALMCLVVAGFESFFGMPEKVMFVLSGVAVFFSVFSFSSYYFAKNRFEKYLSIILSANIVYCLSVSVLMGIYFVKLTVFGIAYFAGEIIIVTMLVYAEYIRVITHRKDYNRL
jgi:hypothetical protein